MLTEENCNKNSVKIKDKPALSFSFTLFLSLNLSLSFLFPTLFFSLPLTRSLSLSCCLQSRAQAQGPRSCGEAATNQFPRHETGKQISEPKLRFDTERRFYANAKLANSLQFQSANGQPSERQPRQVGNSKWVWSPPKWRCACAVIAQVDAHIHAYIEKENVCVRQPKCVNVCVLCVYSTVLCCSKLYKLYRSNKIFIYQYFMILLINSQSERRSNLLKC